MQSLQNVIQAITVCLVFLLSTTAPLLAAELNQQCVLHQINIVDQSMTVEELKALCAIGSADEAQTLGDVRSQREQSIFGDEFSILLHRDNYILPITHNNQRGEVFDGFGEAREIDDEEIKFQISIKSLLLKNLPFGGQLFAAYTNQSHWQAYNSDNSRPFRETNHQPELFIDFPLQKQIRGIKFNSLRLAINHQSNGRSGIISRSWNRAYAELQMSTKYSEVHLRSWWHVADDEDNPDIGYFMGNFQIEGLRRFGKHQLHWKARHNLESDSKGALELGWSRAIGGREDLRFYLQYFNGYGESLIDYNRSTERFGMGVKIGAQ